MEHHDSDFIEEVERVLMQAFFSAGEIDWGRNPSRPSWQPVE